MVGLWSGLACSALCFCLVGLIVLFRIFDGDIPLGRGQPALSFTTVIAIMSKAIQTTLMLPVATSTSQLGWVHFYRPRALVDFQTFDAASRGLLGSLQSTRCFAVGVGGTRRSACRARSWYRGCCTAVSPEHSHVLCSNLGTRSSISVSGLLMAHIPISACSTLGVAAMTTKDAVLQHTFSTPSSRTETVLPKTLLYRCLTAGCQPSPYVTLGFCSTCVDISENLVIQDWCAQRSGNDNGSCGIYILGGPSLHVQTQGLALKATPIIPTNLWQPGELLLG